MNEVKMNIIICVGSSCHLNGSYDVLKKMKEEISSNFLENEIQISTAFCLGKCTNGVSVKFNDEIVCGVNLNNLKEVFEKYVLKS